MREMLLSLKADSYQALINALRGLADSLEEEENFEGAEVGNFLNGATYEINLEGVDEILSSEEELNEEDEDEDEDEEEEVIPESPQTRRLVVVNIRQNTSRRRSLKGTRRKKRDSGRLQILRRI